MSINSLSSLQTGGASLYGQLQQQQAQRAADQAEQNARGLQAEAKNAQLVADRAQRAAQSLKVRSEQATEQANSARRGLAASTGMSAVEAQMSDRHQQLTAVLKSLSLSLTTPVPVAVQPVVNAQGQTTGTLISIKA